MPATAPSIVDSEGITRVELAQLIAMRARAGKPLAWVARARGEPAGLHRSALRARGMDYAESRIYQAGDDVRSIDWRRTARSGKWHTKLFQEEREQSLLLLIDTHASMRFGTRVRFKSVAAANAAAWQAWTSVRGGDRVGALAFGTVRDAIDPRGGTRGALAVAGALARWDTQSDDPAHTGTPEEPLSCALQRAQRLLVPGSRALLLSDGWSTDDAAVSTLAKLQRHVDLRVAIVVDALERTAAPAGTYAFATNAGRVSVNLTDAASRARFRHALGSGSRRLADACDAAGLPWISLAADTDPMVSLDRLWRVRRSRRS